MIRSPLGLRLDDRPDRPTRTALLRAAEAGAKGVVLEAVGPLNPDRLSETGRRDLRHTLRSAELGLIALHLPTRRPFDTDEQLDDRLARLDRAFALAYDLGTRLTLIRAGAIPPESDAPRRQVFSDSLRELARRADHRGIRLAIETGPEPGEALRAVLDAWAEPALAASVDPASLLRQGHDPVAATRVLGEWVAHAYAADASGPSARASLVNPRGSGFPPGVLDWEEYLGALEEINYRGYLTVWPDPALDEVTQFRAIADRLKKY